MIDVRLEAPFFFRGGRRYPRYCTTYRLPYNTHCIRIDTVCIVRLRFIDVAVPVAVRAVGLGVWLWAGTLNTYVAGNVADVAP